MRRLLVAGIAALAVVLGLCTFTSGTAFAAQGGHCRAANGFPGLLDAAGLCVAIDINIGGRDRGGVEVPCAPPVVGSHLVNGVCVPDHHGGNGGGWGNNGDWGNHGHWIPGGNLPWGGPTLYGHQLWLNAQLGLDICGYGNSYDTFLNRNLSHRSDIDRYLGRGRWQSLYTSDCNSNIAVIPGGLTLINGSYLNLDLLGLQGGGLQSVCSYPDWNTFDNRLGSRFGGRWGNVRNRFGGNAFNEFRQLRVNAQCTTIVMPSSTTIVQQPQQALQAEAPAADPSDNAAASAPAPLASGSLPAIAPAKAPNEGGFDLAYVLAHARVA